MKIGLQFCAALLAVAVGASGITSARAQHAVSLTSEPPNSLTGVRFHFQADGPVRGGFARQDGKLLFGTERGTIYALDGVTGGLRWRRSLGSPVLSTPAISGRTVYFTTWDNALHAADAATGQERWRKDLGRTLGTGDYWEYYVSSPQISGGRLYVGSASGRLFAIEPVSGRTLWSFDAGARIRTTPTLAGDLVIIGTMGGEVLAIDRSGRLQWRFRTVGAGQDFAFKTNDTRSVVTQPVVTGNTVIAGGRDGNIYGIDLATGKARWNATQDGGSWILGLAADQSKVYVGGGSAFVMQGLDTATGKEIWRTPTANAMFGGIAKAGNVLVSNGINGMIAGFDTATGARQWRFAMPATTFASPLIADGVIYTGADDGSVFALDTSGKPSLGLNRLVYGFTDEPVKSKFWFKPDVLAAIQGGLAVAGFDKLGSADLAKALAEPITPNGRKLIVLADARLPGDVDGGQLRSFLEGGGVLVLLGVDPLVYGFDADGTPATIDEDKAKAAFGIDPPNKQIDFGNNVSWFTTAGRRLGLEGYFVALGWAEPSQVSTVLATDRSGKATAWIKRFDKGGMLIQLPLPRSHPTDLSRIANAVDLAASTQQ